MKKILIVQGQVPHYRKAFFSALAKWYDITIMHSGKSVVHKEDGFSEQLVPAMKLGPLYYQSGVSAAICRGGYAAAIVMFDVRWIGSVLSTIRHGNTRLCLWGHRYSANQVANQFRNVLMRRADALIQYSECEVPRMIASGISRERIFVAPNTIRIENHQDGSGAQKNSFLFVGRAQPRKRVDVLIRMFARAAAQLPEYVRLNIVGDGDENVALKALAKELGLANRVAFLGEVLDEDKLRQLFHSAYAYVSPGPVGLAVLHSFAYGVPIVTCQTGRHGPEFSNLCDGKNAIVYSHHESLDSILIRLCSDAGYARKLGHEAYEHYTNRRTLQQMVDGFTQAIENRPQSVGSLIAA